MIPVPALVTLRCQLRRICGWQSVRDRLWRGAAILLYHGTFERIEDPICDCYAVDRQTFRAHLRFLRNQGDIVSLEEVISVSRAPSFRRTKQRLFAITFDDALRCQYSVAADLLAENKAPWSMTVPVGLVGTGRSLWTYELRFLLLHAWTHSVVPHPDSRAGYLDCSTQNARVRAIGEVISHFEKVRNSTVCEAYLDGLIDTLGPDKFAELLRRDGRFDLCSWSEIRELRDAGVAMLSHGWRHRPQFDEMDDALLRQEIHDSRQELAARLGVAPRGFALPNGVFSRRTPEELVKAGYSFCVGSRPGNVWPETPLMQLPRFDAEYPLLVLRTHLTSRE